jgi:hypothetical protein
MIDRIMVLARACEVQDATLGVLLWKEYPIACCLENLWRDNRRNISCIPSGFYECHPHKSSRFGETWEVCDVRNRSAIIIHVGNTAKDTRGCLLPGLRFGKLKERPAVTDSRKAMNRLRGLIGVDKPFLLNVRDYKRC